MYISYMQCKKYDIAIAELLEEDILTSHSKFYFASLFLPLEGGFVLQLNLKVAHKKIVW